jgi:hypothetical protein
MSSKAAAAMYPHLAKQEHVEQPVQKRDDGLKPTWGKSNHPLWNGEIRAAPTDYSKVPGLVRKQRR